MRILLGLGIGLPSSLLVVLAATGAGGRGIIPTGMAHCGSNTVRVGF